MGLDLLQDRASLRGAEIDAFLVSSGGGGHGAKYRPAETTTGNSRILSVPMEAAGFQQGRRRV